MLAIASECPAMPAEEFIAVLVQDQKLPADLRVAIVRCKAHLGDPSSSSNEKRKDKAKPKSSTAAKQTDLNMFLGIVLDATAATDQRRKAALEATRYLLPTKPGMGRWWINAPTDEYGFIIAPEIAAEYRDIKFELRRILRSASNGAWSKKKVETLLKREKAILPRLQCPCPSLYGKEQISADRKRLNYFLKQRAQMTLSADEIAEEAHRSARLESFEEGPENTAAQRLRVLKDKDLLARKGGPDLTPKEENDLAFLRQFYSYSRPKHDPCFDEFSCHDYSPLRDEPLADDGNLYAPNSKLREIEEEFVAIPKYCYPPHAIMPPLKDDDVLYTDSKGFRWSNKLLG
jgi:hypothetical protein